MDRAKAEINQLAGFSFEYDAQRVGKKVDRIRLAWGRKNADGLRQADKAFRMTRTERTALRRGVEAVVDERVRIAEELAAAGQWKAIDGQD